MMKNKLMTVVIIVIAIMTGTVQALITPTGIAGVSSEIFPAYGLDRQAIRAIDGSGMTGMGHTNLSDPGYMWTSDGPGYDGTGVDLDPWIAFDLGAVYSDITGIHEWGANDAYSQLGPDLVDVYTSMDNVTYTLVGSVNFAQASGLDGYTGNAVPIVLPAAQYIMLDIMTNHDGAIFDGTGAVPGADGRNLAVISEIRFESPTSTANDPDPYDTEPLVDKNKVLSWTDPAAYTTTAYDLYISTDPNLVENANAAALVSPAPTGPSYDPALDFGTTYYWRVDTYDGATPYEGPVWSFLVAPEAPVVTEDPVPLTVAEGETAVFDVVIANATSYQWKKDGANISDGGAISGATTDTLTITGVVLGDEGNYSCVGTGTGSVESAAAQLITERLVGYWPLDGDLIDAEGDFDGSLPAGNTTAFVAGQIGSGALDFSGTDPNNLVTIDGSEDYYNFYTRGYTASFWFNAPADAVAISFFSKFDGSNGMGFSNYRSGTGLFNYIDGANIAGSSTPDQWNHYAATYDADSTTLTTYVDGQVVSQYTPLVLGASGLSAEPANIGGPQVGLIDDVKLYSYARSAVEVAQDAADGFGVVICPETERPSLDIAPVGALDCKVDLLDFAEFAKQWLDDANVYPN